MSAAGFREPVQPGQGREFELVGGGERPVDVYGLFTNEGVV